jgi:ABC-type antimicrobial peptide transport system permease subunit
LIVLASTEWFFTGLLAACIGAPLGCCAASIALSTLLQRRVIAFSWPPLLTSIPLAILAANLAGWMTSYHLLDAKPMDVLREKE